MDFCGADPVLRSILLLGLTTLDQAQIEDFKDGSKEEIARETEEDSEMKTKHTPGPWNIYFNSQDNLVIRKMFEDGTESHVIARCHSGFENARLIAAAPDLLEALEMLIEFPNTGPATSTARAAIARATGKQP